MDCSLDGRFSDEELDALLRAQAYGRFHEDPDLPPGAARELLSRRVRQSLAAAPSRRVVARAPSGALAGLVCFHLSDWDTEHFGYRCATVDWILVQAGPLAERTAAATAMLQRFAAWCEAERIRFALARASLLDLASVNGLERIGFNLVDTAVYNKYELSQLTGDPPPQALRDARPEDCESMVAYSRGAFATQRFYADDRVDRERADQVYEKWIRNSFTDPHAQISVLDLDGKPAAFMLYGRDELSEPRRSFAVWKLAIIDPAQRGRGLGRTFFLALLHLHRLQGHDVVDSAVSLRNLPSLALHNRLHFKILSTVLTFHRWWD